MFPSWFSKERLYTNNWVPGKYCERPIHKYVLDRHKRIMRFGPVQIRFFYWLYDNTPVHTTAVVAQSSVRKMVPVNLSYFPDLNSLDYFLCTKLKVKLKEGHRLATVDSIWEAAIESSKTLLKHTSGEWRKN